MTAPALSDGPDRRARLLAWVCRCCPFCILARRFPGSAYARALRAAEQRCPACRAYDRVHGGKASP